MTALSPAQISSLAYGQYDVEAKALEVLTGRPLSIHSVLRLDLKQNITAPTGPDLLLVFFTQNKYLHNKK
jgi:hypothetical protein